MLLIYNNLFDTIFFLVSSPPFLSFLILHSNTLQTLVLAVLISSIDFSFPDKFMIIESATAT